MTLGQAIAFAALAHEGQTDKAGATDIPHPLRVMLRVHSEAERRVAVLHAEASSNNYLARENILTEQHDASLRALGWRPPSRGGSPNYTADLKGPRATAQAVTLTVRTLTEVLGTGSPADLEYDAFESKGGPMVLPPLKPERMRRGAR